MTIFFATLLLLRLLMMATIVNTSSDGGRDEGVFICFEGKVRAEQAELGGQFYLQMSELVQKQPGFISQTPFVSVDQAGGQVLYVRFDNEEHLHHWKNNHVHLGIQAKGRADVFVDYRLRIGREAFSDDNDNGDGNTTANTGKYLLMWRYPTSATNATTDENPENMAWNALEPFIWGHHPIGAATYTGETETLRISSWPTKAIGLAVQAGVPRLDGDDLRLIRVARDYGRFQRGEAPGDADRCQEAAARNDSDALRRC